MFEDPKVAIRGHKPTGNTVVIEEQKHIKHRLRYHMLWKSK